MVLYLFISKLECYIKLEYYIFIYLLSVQVQFIF